MDRRLWLGSLEVEYSRQRTVFETTGGETPRAAGDSRPRPRDIRSINHSAKNTDSRVNFLSCTHAGYYHSWCKVKYLISSQNTFVPCSHTIIRVSIRNNGERTAGPRATCNLWYELYIFILAPPLRKINGNHKLIIFVQHVFRLTLSALPQVSLRLFAPISRSNSRLHYRS